MKLHISKLTLFLCSLCSVTVAQQLPAIREGTPLKQLQEEVSKNAVSAAPGAPMVATKIGIPAWLQAHYRRNHAEFLRVATPSDPTGGYPLALRTLYVWMLRHQDLQAPPAGEPPGAIAAVGPNVGISGANGDPRSESDIRINLKNPKQIIGASNNIGNGRQAQFFSVDGGKTWQQSYLPLLPADSLHSDPTVDWTSNGDAWTTTIGINASSTSLQMRAYKSSDSGKTWVFDGTFSGDQTSADKQMMWVDHSPSSHYHDNIYVIWHNGRPAFATRRTTSGWQPPIQLSGAETKGTAIGSDITTNAAGRVFAVWPDTGSKNVFCVQSTDGGASYSSPHPIAKTFGSFQVSVPAFSQRLALIGASVAAYSPSGSDNVYVAWTDLSGADGCKVPDNEPGTNAESSCTTRIWFARSTDAGLTWSAPQKINDRADRSDQFNQKLAVDQQTGTIGIVYYNTGTGADRNKTDVAFHYSTDGGKTWSKPLKVTTERTDETVNGADSGNQYGDYNGLSADGGTFFPSWTDRRKGGSECIFTAQITLKQTPGGAVEPVLSGVSALKQE